MGWSLRVRHIGGQAVLNLCDEGNTTCGELQALIEQQTGIDAQQQEVLAGFPPQAVQVADGAATVASVGIVNGDSLTVRQKFPLQQAAPTAAGAVNGTRHAGSGDSQQIAQNNNTADDDEDALLAAAIAASLQDIGARQQGQQQQQQQQHTSSLQQQRAPATSIAHPPAASGQTPAGKGPAPTSVPLPDGSCVVRRVIPSDNSCLFTAVGYVMEHDRGKAAQLRRVIADAVAADPVTYNDGFLEQTNEEYQAWILNSKHWGGGIELSILAKHYGRVIAAYDIQTKRCDRYGEQDGYTESVMLIYDGLHYDALAVAAFEGAPEELDITVLQLGSMDADAAAKGADQLVLACHQARQFTDTANFTLRCGICQIGLKGEKEAVEHAKATGHQNFAEY